MDDAVRETVDYVAIRRLQDAYADSVTRRAWDELHDQFEPDAAVEVDTVTGPPLRFVGGGGIGDFISDAVARFEFFEMVILNARVMLSPDGDPDAARARCFTCELRQDHASGHWSTAYGVYHDDYRRGPAGTWRFARRRYQSLARTAPATQVFPFPIHPGFD